MTTKLHIGLVEDVLGSIVSSRIILAQNDLTEQS